MKVQARPGNKLALIVDLCVFSFVVFVLFDLGVSSRIQTEGLVPSVFVPLGSSSYSRGHLHIDEKDAIYTALQVYCSVRQLIRASLLWILPPSCSKGLLVRGRGPYGHEELHDWQ